MKHKKLLSALLSAALFVGSVVPAFAAAQPKNGGGGENEPFTNATLTVKAEDSNGSAYGSIESVRWGYAVGDDTSTVSLNYTTTPDTQKTVDIYYCAQDTVTVVEVTAKPETDTDIFKGFILKDATALDTDKSLLTQKFKITAETSTIIATFDKQPKADTYQVTIDPTMSNGSVTANPSTNIKAGDSVTLTVTPDSNYKLEDDSLKANGTSVPFTDGKYTFKMPAEDVTVTAKFVKTTTPPTPEETVTYTLKAGNGGYVEAFYITEDSASEDGWKEGDEIEVVNGQLTVKKGTPVRLTFNANEGYTISKFTENGEVMTWAVGSQLIKTNSLSEKDYAYVVEFERITYTHTLKVTGKGTVSAMSGPDEVKFTDGKATVGYAQDVVYTITPEKDCEIGSVMVNSVRQEIKDKTTMTLTTWGKNVTLEVVFVAKGTTVPDTKPSTDGAAGAVGDLVEELPEDGTSLDPDADAPIIEAIKENVGVLANTSESELQKQLKDDPKLLEKVDKLVEALPEVELDVNFEVPEGQLTEDEEKTLTAIRQNGDPAVDGIGLTVMKLLTDGVTNVQVTQDTIFVGQNQLAASKNTEELAKTNPVATFELKLDIAVTKDGKTKNYTQPLTPLTVKFPLVSSVIVDIQNNVKSYYLNHIADNGAVKNDSGKKVTNSMLDGSFLVTRIGSFSYLSVSASAMNPPVTRSSGSGGSGFSIYWITVEAGPNGSISLDGENRVAFGDSLTVTVTPNAGYMVDKVVIDGTKEVTLTNGQYTFKNVNEPYTIKATFKKASGTAEAPAAPEAKPTTPTAVNPATGDGWFAHLFDGLFN